MEIRKTRPWDEEGTRTYQCFPFTDAIDVYTTIRLTYNKLYRHVSKELEKWELSVPKYGVIRHLYNHESLSLTELSATTFSGNSNFTTLIDRMEKEGIVKRVEKQGDRRVKQIRLTERGLALAPKVISEYRVFLHQMMSNCLTPDEQRTLVDLLDKVMNSIP